MSSHQEDPYESRPGVLQRAGILPNAIQKTWAWFNRNRANVLITGLLVFLPIAVWILIVAPREADEAARTREQHGVRCFYDMVRRIPCAQEATNPESVTAAWDRLLSEKDFVEGRMIVDWSRTPHSNLTVFHVSGTASLQAVWIGVPTTKVGKGDYLAMARLAGPGRVRDHTVVLSYSPSKPHVVYRCEMPLDADVEALFQRVAKEHDWTEAFEPDPEIWTGVYPIDMNTWPSVHLEER